MIPIVIDQRYLVIGLDRYRLDLAVHDDRRHDGFGDPAGLGSR